MPDRDFAPSGFFVSRTPLLPFEEIEAWSEGLPGDWVADRELLRSRLRAIVERPEVLEALFLASPSLVDGLAAWRLDPEGKKGQRAERALVRLLLPLGPPAPPLRPLLRLLAGRGPPRARGRHAPGDRPPRCLPPPHPPRHGLPLRPLRGPAARWEAPRRARLSPQLLALPGRRPTPLCRSPPGRESAVAPPGGGRKQPLRRGGACLRRRLPYGRFRRRDYRRGGGGRPRRRGVRRRGRGVRHRAHRQSAPRLGPRTAGDRL